MHKCVSYLHDAGWQVKATSIMQSMRREKNKDKTKRTFQTFLSFLYPSTLTPASAAANTHLCEVSVWSSPWYLYTHSFSHRLGFVDGRLELWARSRRNAGVCRLSVQLKHIRFHPWRIWTVDSRWHSWGSKTQSDFLEVYFLHQNALKLLF